MAYLKRHLGTIIKATAAEINIMDGVTASTAELNIMDGVDSTAVELNILDGVTSTTAELNILDGVDSTAAEINLLDGYTSLHTATSTAGGPGWSTTYTKIWDDGHKEMKAYASSGNTTGTKTISWPTAFGTIYGASIWVLDNGDRRGYVIQQGAPSVTALNVYYILGGGPGGTSYNMSFGWGTT